MPSGCQTEPRIGKAERVPSGVCIFANSTVTALRDFVSSKGPWDTTGGWGPRGRQFPEPTVANLLYNYISVIV